ncbi:MAG: T9SS type A sorting domain-containing protein [Bacteroidales bacterium]|nr:T9SS type A sorting domain-containing protein [Bacteroidales bacterium]
MKVLGKLFVFCVALMLVGNMNIVNAQSFLVSLPLDIDTGYCFHKNVLIRAVAHPQPEVVYLSTDNGLYKSSDNGESWDRIYDFDTAHTFSKLYFYNENIGLAHKAHVYYSDDMARLQPDSLVKTYDGGHTWTAISPNIINDLYFVGKDTILGLATNLYCSYDGGYTWETLLKQQIHSFSVLDDLTIYAVHGAGSYYNTDEIIPNIRVWKSTDFGKWWKSVFPKGRTSPLQENEESRVPYEISYSHFWDNGKGIIEGHNRILTRNDFETYERKGAFPFDCSLHACKYLKNGYRVILYNDDAFHFPSCYVNLSKSHGWNSKNFQLRDYRYPDSKISTRTWRHAQISSCDEDTTFFALIVEDEEPYEPKSYLFRIKPSDFDGLGPLSVNNLDMNSAVTVSPNPADNAFRVVSESPLKQVAVYDLLGKEVFRRSYSGETATEIAVSAWPSGTYIVKAVTKDGRGEAKVVKR